MKPAPTTAEIPDRRLGLMFACAHPAIDAAIRAPLMLQAILGLDAARIASAFLVSPATMSQRLVRAKNKIRQAGIPLEIPERSQLRSRLDTVLDAIYAAFSEGWIDAAGTDVARRDLAEEAIYLGRVIVELLPDEPEGLGLLALMLHAEARRRARRNARATTFRSRSRTTALWNAEMIAEAESLLHRAGAMNVVGRYQLEAAIQSAHAARDSHGQSDWAAIVQLYDALLALSGSPVAAVNRALAVAELQGAHQRASRIWMQLPPIRDWPSISHTGPRARNCWPASTAAKKHVTHTRSPSVLSAIRRCVDSSNSGECW